MSHADRQPSTLLVLFGEPRYHDLVLRVSGDYAYELREDCGAFLDDWDLPAPKPRPQGLLVWAGDVWWDGPASEEDDPDIHFDGEWRAPTGDEVSEILLGDLPPGVGVPPCPTCRAPLANPAEFYEQLLVTVLLKRPRPHGPYVLAAEWSDQGDLGFSGSVGHHDSLREAIQEATRALWKPLGVPTESEVEGWTLGEHSVVLDESGAEGREYGAMKQSQVIWVRANGDVEVELGPAGGTIPFGVLAQLLAQRGIDVTVQARRQCPRCERSCDRLNNTTAGDLCDDCLAETDATKH